MENRACVFRGNGVPSERFSGVYPLAEAEREDFRSGEEGEDHARRHARLSRSL